MATETDILEYSIVIPIKDEAENILATVNEIEPVMLSTGKQWELIFVDDGSTDGSLEIIKKLCAEKPFLRLIAFTRNFGQSSAFKAGFDAAQGHFVITCDGDLQNDPKDIPCLIKEIHNCDLVVGWRKERKDPWKKRVISKISNRIRSKLCQDGVHDTGCSLKIYRASALKKIKMYHGMHRFLPALFLIEGFKVKEVVVNHRERTKGKTKYRFFNRFLGPIVDMLVVKWMRDRHLKHEIAGEFSKHKLQKK
jgi:dolichol-phosphate mannosyltransferase